MLEISVMQRMWVFFVPAVAWKIQLAAGSADDSSFLQRVTVLFIRREGRSGAGRPAKPSRALRRWYRRRSRRFNIFLEISWNFDEFLRSFDESDECARKKKTIIEQHSERYKNAIAKSRLPFVSDEIVRIADRKNPFVRSLLEFFSRHSPRTVCACTYKNLDCPDSRAYFWVFSSDLARTRMAALSTILVCFQTKKVFYAAIRTTPSVITLPFARPQR